MDEDIQPLMAEFGAAVHDAQVLEGSIELILSLLDQTARSNEKVPGIEALFAVYSDKTLGQLIGLLKQRITVTGSEEKLLKEALGIRNHLVHAFFKQEDRLRSTLTPDGITSLIDEIGKIRTLIRQANDTSDRMLDELLKKYGLSVETLKEHAVEMYRKANLEYFQRVIH